MPSNPWRFRYPPNMNNGFPIRFWLTAKSAPGLYRDNNGLWINLNEGEHQVVLGGAVPLLSKFTLPLPLKPNWVSIQNTGWQVIGLQENNEVDDQLQFSRINQTQQQKDPLGT